MSSHMENYGAQWGNVDYKATKVRQSNRAIRLIVFSVFAIIGITVGVFAATSDNRGSNPTAPSATGSTRETGDKAPVPKENLDATASSPTAFPSSQPSTNAPSIEPTPALISTPPSPTPTTYPETSEPTFERSVSPSKAPTKRTNIFETPTPAPRGGGGFRPGGRPGTRPGVGR